MGRCSGELAVCVKVCGAVNALACVGVVMATERGWLELTVMVTELPNSSEKLYTQGVVSHWQVIDETVSGWNIDMEILQRAVAGE